MRDKVKEEQNRGKPHWEHLNDELHVLLTVEEASNRAEPLLKRAVKGIKKFMEVIPEGEDFLKRTQLMELAAYNNQQPKGLKPHQMLPQMAQGLQGLPQAPRVIPPQYAVQAAMRSPTPAGAPIILHSRLQNPQASGSGLLSGMPPPGMMSPTEAATMIYGNPYDYQFASHMPTLLDYQSAQQAAQAQMEQSAAGASAKVRRVVGTREHPYSRVALS